MNILVRADSSSTIGTGHIMRDLVLAKQYRDSNIIFATQNLKGNINHKIVEDEYKIIELNSNDIDEVLFLIKKHSIDMIVIDHYSIDWEYEKELKTKYPKLKIMVLDDTYEKHYSDILLNHNISADRDKYKELVPNNCELRCGTEYTLLRDEFIEEKKKKTIFLAMGGADEKNINFKILKVLKQFKDIEVNLVTTTANPNIKVLEQYIEGNRNIKLHINSNQLAKLMKKSDLAIISPSVIVHEVLYMNLPLIAIKTADNQDDVYKYLKNNKYLVLKQFKKKKLKKKVKKSLGDI